jgi:hypothetical protein
MDKNEKIEFVTALSDRIRDEIIGQIRSGKILHEWDGHELRTLLRDRHQLSADMSKQAMRGRRGKIFRNHCLIANL